MTRDAIDWAREQLEHDARENDRFPGILTRKSLKLAASPFAFFRGTAPLFYSYLAAQRSSFELPGPLGFVVGDAHLENFGVFRTAAEKSEKSLVFDLNDLDEVGFGELAVDPLRLGASLLLASRELRISGTEAATLLVRLIDAYCAATEANADDVSLRSPMPECVRKLVERVERRTKRDFLDKRTAEFGSERRFLRGDRYADIPSSWARSLEAAVPEYAKTILAPEELPADGRDLEDAAFRIAGTGSLGCLRLASLHRGKGGGDGEWLLDWKEERKSALGVLHPQPTPPPPGRIVSGMRAFLERPPRLLGYATLPLDGPAPRLFVVRRLNPQEDKLDLTTLDAAAIPQLVAFLGTRLGMAHLRANASVAVCWNTPERAALVRGATKLAGFFEAVFLAYCHEQVVRA